MGQKSRNNRPIPEYLDAAEVEALVELAPHGPAKLLILMQWRAGLRFSEALKVKIVDVRFGPDNPTLRVSRGKGNAPRIVPLHPQLGREVRSAMDYGLGKNDRPLVDVTRSTGSRWIAQTVERAVKTGVLPKGRRVSSHTLRHSYARHLLANGTAMNVLSLWLGHASIETTLIYLKLLPDPAGSMERIP